MTSAEPSSTDQAVDYSFLDPAVMDDPFDAYAQLHERCPVHRMPETGLVLVTKYDDVRSVLTDPQTFSSRPSSGAGRQTDVAMAYHKVLADEGWVRASTLQRTDPPEHTRWRKMLNRVFTGRRVRELTPSIDEVANELIDAFIERGSVEFVQEFAMPLPGIVIAEQLGLPRSEISTFARWADAMLAMAQRVLTEEEAVAEARVELEAQHFFAQQVEDRRANPRDDLISGLANTRDDDGELLSMEVLQDLFHQLITGGFETTTAALSAGMWLLLRYPDQQALLRSDRSLMKAFVDETLRFDSPVQGLWRMTACPAEVRGVEIQEGEPVMARFGAANRDPEVFPEPAVFDITRENADQHVAFGLGNHFCIGAALARQEMYSAFSAILDRMDDLELAEPLEALAHVDSFFLRPMKRLPVSFRAVAN